MAVNPEDIKTYVLARSGRAVYAEVVASVGENVKRLRKAAGIATQGALAEKMGIPQPRVSDLENDRYLLPDTKTLLLAAAAIGCRVDDLLEGVDEAYDWNKNILAVTRRHPTDRRAKQMVLRATRLLELMSDAGQRHALGLLAEVAKAFPRQRRPESVAKSE